MEPKTVKQMLFQPKYAPTVVEESSEESAGSVTSLDSDEENCVLMTNSGRDINFKCQQEEISDYRQNIIEKYLYDHQIPGIPKGVKCNNE